MSDMCRQSTYAAQVHWPLALGLAAIALVRPILNVFGVMDDVKPVGPLVVTLLITVVWIVVVVMARVPQPLPTLVVAGVAYAVLAIALSGILSPLVDGELKGPLVNPIAIVPMLIVNALWGLVAGLIAETLRRKSQEGDVRQGSSG